MMISPDSTVSELAKQLRISRSSVVVLIQSGKLDAYDASPTGAYRQWRITPKALERFREQNKAKPPTKNRRRKPAVGVKEFF